MKMLKQPIVIIIVISSLLLIGATCKQSKEKQPKAKTKSEKQVQAKIRISDYSFKPANLTISSGQKVTWVNEDGVAHTVTSEEDHYDSGELSEGKTFSRVFTKRGSVIFKYICKIHPSMAGQITVR